MLLAAVRRSGGATEAVSEAEIERALAELGWLGLYLEPTSSSAAAALTRLLEGDIRPDEITVLVLTGPGLKPTRPTSLYLLTVGQISVLTECEPAAVQSASAWIPSRG